MFTQYRLILLNLWLLQTLSFVVLTPKAQIELSQVKSIRKACLLGQGLCNLLSPHYEAHYEETDFKVMARKFVFLSSVYFKLYTKTTYNSDNIVVADPIPTWYSIGEAVFIGFNREAGMVLFKKHDPTLHDALSILHENAIFPQVVNPNSVKVLTALIATNDELRAKIVKEKVDAPSTMDLLNNNNALIDIARQLGVMGTEYHESHIGCILKDRFIGKDCEHTAVSNAASRQILQHLISIPRR